ncbi:sugar phosphate isomerase/epimerase family protein [Pseudalkalibacillus decolorationis]|uniref:sugar phosphate isomerase/epimerase family protein n=1 Tax=Pseudalkalibacillus decolorationis TaxID=163879 RepID=UPI002147E8A2|nr:sugar phosphate isomerase/epimerase [Pseudalkalibacillus decolorationis]
MENIIVTLNSFDTKEVMKKGQGHFLPLIAQSGAKGAEIRKELFADERFSLKTLREEIEELNLFSIYSAPVELYDQLGNINEEAIKLIVSEAVKLGATIVKFSLGHYDPQSSSTDHLKELLTTLQIEKHQLVVTIENDQTEHGGNLKRIQHFFKETMKREVPVKMTFDVGNWMYTGEDVWLATKALSEYVVYLHFKHVEHHDNKLVTLSLPEQDSSGWRKLIQSFPNDILRAIEFPLQDQEVSRYVSLLANV